MKSLLLRKKFFDFFKNHRHYQATSSSLIPAQDPTLLFTNAGMNQFKDVFLGQEKRNYTTAVSIQKCVRAGGKHNDLDNVGFTKRHLTFFEMMGNFSFGDYFKKEAIAFAWNFLTQELGLKPEDMFVSVYQEDDESFGIWNKQIGIPAERIMRFGKKDNFWQMGDSGPCGPCTEIYIDQRIPEERKTVPTYQDFEDGKLLEIWNLVFMQYDMQEDGSLKPLQQTGVDTGMGLERIACVLQGKTSVFHTDLFAPLICGIETLTGLAYEKQNDATKAAFHVLADHIRSSCLIIADGGSPSNEGRGYVLRKIIRRAALFSQKLSDKNIFPELAKVFIKEFAPIYPELETNKAIITNLLTNEIEQFSQNLVKGQVLLEGLFEKNKEHKKISGQEAFKLYDTYGFPLEVTILACQERGFTVDTPGFQACMEEQKKLSGKKMKDTQKNVELPETVQTVFTGYDHTATSSTIQALLDEHNMLVDTLPQGATGWIIPYECPFFVSTGGQVDDTATVTINNTVVPVHALKKIGRAIAYKITTPHPLKIKTTVEQQVNVSVRRMTMNNHTATHLLQAALIELFGKQIKQSGSVVEPDYLRFDFTYHKNLTTDEIKQVEDRVNAIIQENIPLKVFETSYKKAVEEGVIAIFGEKYNPECVRVVDVPGFSAELCGGTHVPATGVIGAFKITDMTALSAGNRRIFAVTGPKAIELMQENFTTVKTLSQEFKVKPDEVIEAIQKQKNQLTQTQQALKLLKKELITLAVPQWAQETTPIKSIPFLCKELDNTSGQDLKDAATLLNKQQPGLYLFITNTDQATSFYCSLDEAYKNKIDFEIIKTILAECGLRGGGKGTTLQGGGSRIEADKLAALLKKELS